MSASPSPDDRLLELAGRLLAGEAIDWDKEQLAESEVREGMKRLQHLLKPAEPAPQTESEEASVRGRSNRFIGDFRLVRKLGEGGMGVVYEAEQQHPRRPVALKVIRGGRLVDAHALRLFQREIHTLARLGHPGIAQLYEAGVTDDGMHFFAMELVRGVSLSEWLKKRGDGPVTPAEMRIRLGVFRKICDAVAYAHQKGVIHRDLKPANILIPTAKAGSSVPDAVPEVKILDFGLARMTDTDVQMTTFHTDMGRVQGTLPYMSPEQIRGNPDEIDLRTDVYSLGVILYELITAKLPLDVSKAQLPEAMRIICDEAPRSISATFTGTKRLDADVVTIAGKCLEKETARRYQSAAALAEDIQRYLSDQPIQARPPSAAYQLRKLVRRHKGPFAVAGGAFVLLLAFSVAMTIQTFRVSHERDRANTEAATARKVSEFVDGLFRSADPWAVGDKNVSPRELLDRGAERMETELRDQPAVQARLLRTMGVVYRGLGDGEKARSYLDRALMLCRTVYGEESLEYVDVLTEIGGVERLEQADRIRSRLLPANDARLARGLWMLGLAKMDIDAPDADETFRRGLSVLQQSPTPDRQLELFFYNDLGMNHLKRGEYADAVDVLERSVEIREEIYPEDHVDRIMGLSTLGYSLMLAGRSREARPYIEQGFTSMTRFHPGHFLVSHCAQSLGELERREGNLTRARSLLELALRRLDEWNPQDSSGIEVLTSLALVDESENRLSDAIAHLERAHRMFQRESGISAVRPAADYARVLRKAGRVAEAEQVEAESSAAGQRTPVEEWSRSPTLGKGATGP